MIEVQKNWAGNYTYTASHWQSPTTAEEVQAIVRNSSRIKGLGSRHSFNAIADCEETIISLKAMHRMIEINTDQQTVTVEGGMTYGQLCKVLHEHGFALANLASLPHISIVGACMTGTHGSGEKNGNLATSVSALEMVNGEGEIVHYSRVEHGDEFAGMVVSLGALGIITRITLDIVPAFDVRQDVYLNLPLPAVLANFDAIQASAYSVSLFTNWAENRISQTWIKSKLDAQVPFALGDNFFGARLATVACSPVGDDRTARCTEQLGIGGAWYDRLPHFRMEFTPSHGDEIQSEYFVPRESALEAIEIVNALHEDITPLLHITEIRTIAGDNLWLSPAYGRDSVAIHFTWKPMWTEIAPVLKQIETQLMPLGVRPHWGKVFSLPADYIQAQYQQLNDFRGLMAKHDPQGKFRNPFIEQYIN